MQWPWQKNESSSDHVVIQPEELDRDENTIAQAHEVLKRAYDGPERTER